MRYFEVTRSLCIHQHRVAVPLARGLSTPCLSGAVYRIPAHSERVHQCSDALLPYSRITLESLYHIIPSGAKFVLRCPCLLHKTIAGSRITGTLTMVLVCSEGVSEYTLCSHSFITRCKRSNTICMHPRAYVLHLPCYCSRVIIVDGF